MSTPRKVVDHLGRTMCSKCKEWKGSDGFHKDPRKTTGLASRCKACAAAYSKWHAENYPTAQEVRLRAARKYREANRELERERHRKWKIKVGYRGQPSNYKARCRAKLAYYVKKGRVIKPSHCSKCGAPPPIEAHHEDYSKPCDVQWLCRVCHGKKHQIDLV